MALNTEESKSVAVRVWERLNANSGNSYGSKAFMKLVEQEYNAAVLAKQALNNPPNPVPTTVEG